MGNETDSLNPVVTTSSSAQADFMKSQQFSRGKLARLAGVNFETVRYYENAGLMPEPRR
jgi:hypothetical protein